MQAMIRLAHRSYYRGKMPLRHRAHGARHRGWQAGLEHGALAQAKENRSRPADFSWVESHNSALNSRNIARGRGVGNVIVQRKTDKGLVDEVHDVTFAFVFNGFRPDGKLHKIKSLR